MNSIQLIFANYHCATEITECITILFSNCKNVSLDILVINNGGPVFDAASIELPSGSSLTCISPNKNSGYFGALRMAMKVNHLANLKYRILCNPDIEFRDADFFTRLTALTQQPNNAVIAPAVFSTRTGLDQNPFLRLPPSAALLLRWRFVYTSWLTYILNDYASSLRSLFKKLSDPARQELAGPIHAPHGALIVFTENFLQQAKQLNQVPFLFGEELFIGEICRRDKWVINYEPSLVVWHREHATTGILNSKRRFELQRESLLSFIKFLS
jgi:hypothetical protein